MNCFLLPGFISLLVNIAVVFSLMIIENEIENIRLKREIVNCMYNKHKVGEQKQ